MINDFLKSEINEILKEAQSSSVLDFPMHKTSEELNSLLEFYKSETNYLCTIEGPFGTFKTKTISTSLNYLNDNVLVFKFECFDSTTLDDMFLAFFSRLKEFHQAGKIRFSKMETNSLSEKINRYLSHIEQPAIIIIDSFENILSRKQDKEEIVNFIEHLAGTNKFKILVLSRLFENCTFTKENKTQISLSALNKEEIEEYLISSSIKPENNQSEELYEATRGNCGYISMSIRILKSLQMPLGSLLSEFSKKKTTYEDFIFQKLLSLVPETFRRGLSFLTLINTGLTREFLIMANWFTDEQINYLIEKEILHTEGGYIYLKSYLKKHFSASISHFEKLKIHEYLKNFYETQLPLKPNQRIIPISRTTMRNQIEYHGTFIDKNSARTQPDMTYAGYLSSNITQWTIPDRKSTSVPDKRPSKDSSIPKAGSMEKYELTKEELALLGLPVELSDIPKTKKASPIQEAPFLNLIEDAKSLIEEHDYDAALGLLETAFKRYNEAQYENKLPEIVENTVLCLKKLNKIDDAIDSLEQLYNFYYTKQRPDEANCVLLEIAKTYRESYRFLKSKEIYDRLINSKLPVEPDTLARALVGAASILEDSSDIQNAALYYQKAFLLDSQIKDKSILSEARFKYALILDDENKTSEALHYYQKAVEYPDITGSYTSSVYTNIAAIMYEQGDLKEAYRNYRTALKFDAQSFNHEGIYYLCTKLAEICKTIKPDLVLNYLLKGLSAAKHLSDKHYTAVSYIEVADCYYSVNNYEKALKAYQYAKDILTKLDSGKEEFVKIERKINELKTKQ